MLVIGVGSSGNVSPTLLSRLPLSRRRADSELREAVLHWAAVS